jgi:hypothetical protein
MFRSDHVLSIRSEVVRGEESHLHTFSFIPLAQSLRPFEFTTLTERACFFAGRGEGFFPANLLYTAEVYPDKRFLFTRITYFISCALNCTL